MIYRPYWFVSIEDLIDDMVIASHVVTLFMNSITSVY
jgi:hypothetical protein